MEFEYGKLSGSTYTVTATAVQPFELLTNYNIVELPITTLLPSSRM